MRFLFGRFKRYMPSGSASVKYGAALIIIILCMAYTGHAFSKQLSIAPENPMEGYAKNNSQVTLQSVSGHAAKSDEHKKSTNKTVEASKERNSGKNKQAEQTALNKEQTEKEEPKKNNTEKSVPHINGTATDKPDDLSVDRPAAGQKSKEPDHGQDKQGTGSFQRPGQNQGVTNGQENDQQAQQPNDIQKPEDENEDQKKDEDNIEIVNPDKETDSLEANDYFTTTIIDKEIVTEKAYSFVIKQKQHDYTVKDISVSINRQIESDFTGSVTLVEGSNAISVAVTYQDKKEKIFTVSKDYTVFLEKGEIIIYSSLDQEMEASKAELVFNASAQRDGEEVEVLVFANGEELTEISKGKYSTQLHKGQNKITVSASDGRKSVEEEYLIEYKQKASSLKIETDLKDQEVPVPDFQFHAIAKDDSKQVGLTVEVNGELAVGSNDGNYSLKLQEGRNKIVLKAYSGADAIIQHYEVAFIKPAGTGETEAEEDEYAPKIVTDLVDGTTIKGTIKTFNVWPVDHKGKRIKGSHVIVTVNGSGVPFVWDDSTKTSYTLNLKDGKNKVTITVSDDEGRNATETFYIHATKAADGEVIGKATISIEASTVGLGYLIPPTEIEIHQGEKTSYILDQLLRDNGFTYTNTGTLESSFYLSAISKPGLVTNPVIPEDLLMLVREASTRFDLEDYDPDGLGEFDFANGSGWMYSVNGDYPNFGFADSYLLDGDVVRIRYTLHYGKDIGGSESMGGGEGEDWHKEW